jgi:hypothetical protein
LLCPAELTAASPPALVGIVHAHSPAPHAAIVVGLCEACRGPAAADGSGDYETMQQRILPALRRVWPDARAIKISSAVGHA